MKNKFLTLVALTSFSYTSVFAQHFDINLNVLNFAFSKYELGAEFGFNDKIAAGININTSSKNMTESGGKDYAELNLIPTFKYFSSPEKGADGFYLGAFARYRSSSSKNNDFLTTDNNNIPVIENTNVSSSAIGLGALTGYKWVAGNGFIVEGEFGIGKILSNSVAISNSKADDETKNLTLDWDEKDYLPILGNRIPVDIRLGVKIGYRIK
jgi:hypothetical protein